MKITIERKINVRKTLNFGWPSTILKEMKEKKEGEKNPTIVVNFTTCVIPLALLLLDVSKDIMIGHFLLLEVAASTV
jgi:hypothetical protein